MNDTSPLTFARVAKRLLLMFGSIVVTLVLLLAIGSLSSMMWEKEIFFLRPEEVAVGLLLIPAFWAALIVDWAVSRKVAKGIFIGSMALFLVWLGAVATYETIETKKMIASMETIVPPAETKRILEGNEDKLSAVPVLGCIDFMNEGCPLIARTWAVEEGKKLDRKDLEKAIEDSGWDVSVNPDRCELESGQLVETCEATGTFDGYEASIYVAKIGDKWQFAAKLVGQS